MNVATAGTYAVSFRVAAPSAVTDAFHLSNASGTNLSGNVNIAATGGFQTWTTVTANVTLPAGKQVLTLNEDNGGWNINYLAFASSNNAFGGTPAPVPGTVQAENYDLGGQGAAYNVTSVNGTGNSYRSDGVDLEATSDTGGGSNLGWTGTGQWFKYTVNVATAGPHRQLPSRGAVRGDRRVPPVQRLRHQPERQRERSLHRRMADLDDGHGQRHPAGRSTDPDAQPGQRRLEHQLHDVLVSATAKPEDEPCGIETPQDSVPAPTSLRGGRQAHAAYFNV